MGLFREKYIFLWECDPVVQHLMWRGSSAELARAGNAVQLKTFSLVLLLKLLS